MVNGSGNGGGKTYGIIAIIAAICWPGLAPTCFASPVFKDWKFPKRIRIVSTPKELEEIGSLQTSILELFPKGRYEAQKKGKAFPSQFKTDTGFVIDLMSYEQDKSEMAGPTIGLLLFNEPPPESLWKEGLSRMRKGGIVLVAMTSLLSEPWVIDGILGKADGQNVRVIYADVEENCIQHGKNGTLEHDQIEKILAQYDPDEREARKTGRGLALSGRIFKTFDRSVHVAKEPIVPPAEGITHYHVVDPAIGKPLASIWAYVDATGQLAIYDEWPDYTFEGAKDANLTVKDYVGLFQIQEKARKIETRILDRHFGNARRTMGGLTLRQEFGEAGLDFIDSYTMDPQTEVETGITKVRDYLRYDKAKILDNLNRPRLIISPTCKNTIAAMERWARNPDTLKPAEPYKDFADVVRYLVMANPEHSVTRPWGQGSPAYYGV